MVKRTPVKPRNYQLMPPPKASMVGVIRVSKFGVPCSLKPDTTERPDAHGDRARKKPKVTLPKVGWMEGR